MVHLSGSTLKNLLRFQVGGMPPLRITWHLEIPGRRKQMRLILNHSRMYKCATKNLKFSNSLTISQCMGGGGVPAKVPG
jgi:hypothetical protein